MSDHNPPAFARTSHPKGWLEDPSQTGMSLRDYFAGQALIGIVTQNHGNDWGVDGKRHAPICAKKAYAAADAMLEARKGGDA